MRFFSTSINPVDKDKQTQVIARVNRKGFIGGNSTLNGASFINSRDRRETESEEEDPRNFPRVERMWAMNTASKIQQERFNRHCTLKIRFILNNISILRLSEHGPFNAKVVRHSDDT